MTNKSFSTVQTAFIKTPLPSYSKMHEATTNLIDTVFLRDSCMKQLSPHGGREIFPSFVKPTSLKFTGNIATLYYINCSPRDLVCFICWRRLSVTVDIITASLKCN